MILGVALALAGAALMWLGLLGILGWPALPLFAGIFVTSLGACAVWLAGNVQRDNLPRAFATSGASFLLAAGLTAFKAGEMIDAGSGADALQLWILMAAGVLLFFGLSLWIGAAFALLISKG